MISMPNSLVFEFRKKKMSLSIGKLLTMKKSLKLQLSDILSCQGWSIDCWFLLQAHTLEQFSSQYRLHFFDLYPLLHFFWHLIWLQIEDWSASHWVQAHPCVHFAVHLRWHKFKSSHFSVHFASLQLYLFVCAWHLPKYSQVLWKKSEINDRISAKIKTTNDKV